MPNRVKSLANLIKSKMKQGRKYVLMLGAGASYSSGIPPTGKMIAGLVRDFGQQYEGTLDEKFDGLWREASVDERVVMLEPYLKDKTPSIGYHKLAELVKNGYFDLILTFNFDHLLEDALDKASFNDYRVIINGDVKENRILGLLRTPEPRVKVLKLHGDLKSRIFTFSRDEILEYHAAVKSVVAKYSKRDIIICGYAFNDVNVIKAFSNRGGSIYFVNPAGAGNNIRGFLVSRKSTNKVIKDEMGKFDNFFTALGDRLRRMETEEKAIGLARDLVGLRDIHKRLHAWKEWHYLLQLLDSRFEPVRAAMRQKELADIEKELQPSKASISDELVPLAERIEYRDFPVKDLTNLKQKLKEIDEALEDGSPVDRIQEFASSIDIALYRANDGLEETKAGLDDLSKKLPKRLREIENRLGKDDPLAIKELVGDMGDFIKDEGCLVEWGELHDLLQELKREFEVIHLEAEYLDFVFVKVRWLVYRDTVLDKLAGFRRKIECIAEARLWIDELIRKGKDIDCVLNSPESLRKSITEFNGLIGRHFVETDEALKRTAERLDDLSHRIQERI